MFSKRIMIFLTTVVLVLSGMMAYAHERNGDATAFFYLKKTAVNIPQVIQGIEKGQNGKVISFKLKRKEDDDTIKYEMKIIKDGKVIEAKVEPKSGKIIATESGGIFSSFSDEQKEIPSPAKLSLRDAISVAEKQYGGIAIAGAFQEKSNPKMYRIKLASNEGAFMVMVDADNGELFRLSTNDGRGENDEGDED